LLAGTLVILVENKQAGLSELIKSWAVASNVFLERRGAQHLVDVCIKFGLVYRRKDKGRQLGRDGNYGLNKIAATTCDSLATCDAAGGNSGREKERDGVVDRFEIPAQSGPEAILAGLSRRWRRGTHRESSSPGAILNDPGGGWAAGPVARSSVTNVDDMEGDDVSGLGKSTSKPKGESWRLAKDLTRDGTGTLNTHHGLLVVSSYTPWAVRVEIRVHAWIPG
jgi:hypothetical protein